MVQCHHVTNTVTRSNHRIRDPSITGTTLERFRVGSHGPGTADSPLTQPGGGTRPLGRHSTGHSPRREKLHGQVTRSGPNRRPKPGTNTNRKQHSIPGHSKSRRADWHTAPTPIPRSEVPRTRGLVARRSARNAQLEARLAPNSGGPAKQRGVTVDGRRSPRNPPKAAPAPVPGHSFPATAACRGRGASFPLRSHFEVRGGGHTAPKPNVAPFGARPGRRAREARRRVATTTMKLQRTNHNVSRCKYKFKCLD